MLHCRRLLTLDHIYWNSCKIPLGEQGTKLIQARETAAEENSTSYFPLLDRIAEGVFAELDTEKALFNKFLTVLHDDGHITDPEALASFKFALSIHSAAPRIEAHYQYYQTSVEPNMMAAQDAACPVWVHFDDKQYCSPTLERAQQDISMDGLIEELPFDRVTGDAADSPPSILYADITHPLFGQFHEMASQTAKQGKSSYRLRHRPSAAESRPLYLNGFGVDLTLKRTDYIVLDDREAAKSGKEEQKPLSSGELSEETPADLKPLTTSELSSLGLNTASYVVSSQSPLDTLLKISADFPRYSSMIANHNATEDFLSEYKNNRAAFLPQGYSIIWINGVQVDTRTMNAFALQDHLKRERSLINNMRDLGFTASQAVDLLSHPAIAQAQVEDEPHRYDWRDETEGGQIIMWLNDIEKDKRYSGWSSQLSALMQRTFPGQLPTCRRDIHNLIIPVNLADPQDLQMIVESLQSFVRRTVPVRFGLVPTLPSPESGVQAKIAYHILETYGLSPLFAYFEKQAIAKKPAGTSKSSFTAAIEDRKVRNGQEAVTFDALQADERLKQKVKSVKGYLSRLSLEEKTSTFLINGVALPRNDNWLDAMSSRVSMDLRAIQRGVMEESFTEESWLPEYFLFQAASRRNALIVPDDLDSIKILDVGVLAQDHFDVLDDIPRFSAAQSSELKDWAYLLLVADFDSDSGKELLKNAAEVEKDYAGTEVLLLHNPISSRASSGLSFQLYDLLKKDKRVPAESLLNRVFGHDRTQPTQAMAQRAADYWSATQRLADAVGLSHGESGVVLNGRLVGPITDEDVFVDEDFVQLLTFERQNRINHVVSALTDLKLENKIPDPLSLAKLTSLVARAHVSDIPEGIFESTPLIRINKFNLWNSTNSAIHVSTTEDPSIQIVAAIDPASEVVQAWIPILKTLSEMHGVDLKIFMNPRERVLELSIKRFYRQVLDSAPVFDESGALRRPQATFAGIPEEALLNLGMDVPASWLVAPKECSYDLDNIKLSSVPQNQDVDAIYELENILIEGHSREVATNSPPRGVQLLLGTEKEPHFADTIIMANLGYFQFKANPGYWHISLMPGRSSKIFDIDSVGNQGYSPRPGDLTTSLALKSFQGATIYPRLSRKPGMETEDVLESGAKPGSAMDYLNRGASFASSALNSVGLSKQASSSGNADINIFSVASGHLYERMLNIMILSVMKHTRHTVKFWFIEQFLSPSFKSSLPHLATHYNFDYEMVTYKWPHWLRRQKEKQREIWGYKILFLDVLFPLNLDKVIFVDADQIVRTDMMELNRVDLHGAPYGFTPMCDSRTEMEGFRFWKQGYWRNYLQGKPYHISALYVVDLKKFRELAAGDRLRQQYHALSADPASLSNLDQDLPNHMQHNLPIFSLPQEWLWCETWCADAELGRAKTIDLCNNPLTKEPKLERARRQVPEWVEYDEEIAGVLRNVREKDAARTVEVDKQERDRREGEGGQRTRDEL
jgi:UDP-glucose:glycoprotein glucosyltransferase